MADPRKVRFTIEYDGTKTVYTQETKAQAAAGAGGNYTVVSGDTLWGIAKKFYGSGAKYTVIYEANREKIENTAKARGKSSSENGHWIFPGEVLTIPGTSLGTAPVPKKSGEAKPYLGKDIEERMTDISYVDAASGDSDSISISINNIGLDWLGNKMPERGAVIGAKASFSGDGDETEFVYGSFVLDDISFSGRPLTCTIGGVSVPAMEDFKTRKKTKTWEKTTLKEIASEIAKTAGVSLYFDAADIAVDENEQTKVTDSSYLASMCDKYGYALKIYNHKIVIFKISDYEKKAAVMTLHEKDLTSWSYNTTVHGTYTGVEFSYKPTTKNVIHVMIGTEGRVYSMDTQAANQNDAELQAVAKLDEANRQIETMEISLYARPAIVAGQCINIEGIEKASGKYFVDSIKHSYNDSGYSMSMSLHKVQGSFGDKAQAAAGAGGNYTVVSGDTLWGIAKKFYGSGAKYTVIYEANREKIENTAKARGKSSSENGHWIFPGEVLTIPEV